MSKEQSQKKFRLSQREASAKVRNSFAKSLTDVSGWDLKAPKDRAVNNGPFQTEIGAKKYKESIGLKNEQQFRT